MLESQVVLGDAPFYFERNQYILKLIPGISEVSRVPGYDPRDILEGVSGVVAGVFWRFPRRFPWIPAEVDIFREFQLCLHGSENLL